MSNAFNCRKLSGPMGEQIGNYILLPPLILLWDFEFFGGMLIGKESNSFLKFKLFIIYWGIAH